MIAVSNMKSVVEVSTCGVRLMFIKFQILEHLSVSNFQVKFKWAWPLPCVNWAYVTCPAAERKSLVILAGGISSDLWIAKSSTTRKMLEHTYREPICGLFQDPWQLFDRITFVCDVSTRNIKKEKSTQPGRDLLCGTSCYPILRTYLYFHCMFLFWLLFLFPFYSAQTHPAEKVS